MDFDSFWNTFCFLSASSSRHTGWKHRSLPISPFSQEGPFSSLLVTRASLKIHSFCSCFFFCVSARLSLLFAFSVVSVSQFRYKKVEAHIVCTLGPPTTRIALTLYPQIISKCLGFHFHFTMWNGRIGSFEHLHLTSPEGHVKRETKSGTFWKSRKITGGNLPIFFCLFVCLIAMPCRLSATGTAVLDNCGIYLIRAEDKWISFSFFFFLKFGRVIRKHFHFLWCVHPRSFLNYARKKEELGHSEISTCYCV